jgi:hypothetical protein
MRKILALLVIVLFLIGCGGKKIDHASNETQPEEYAKETVHQEPVVVIEPTPPETYNDILTADDDFAALDDALNNLE